MIYITIKNGTKERSQLCFSTKEAISWINGMTNHTVWDCKEWKAVPAPFTGKVIIKFGNRYTKKTEVRKFASNDDAVKELAR